MWFEAIAVSLWGYAASVHEWTQLEFRLLWHEAWIIETLKLVGCSCSTAGQCSVVEPVSGCADRWVVCTDLPSTSRPAEVCRPRDTPAHIIEMQLLRHYGGNWPLGNLVILPGHVIGSPPPPPLPPSPSPRSSLTRPRETLPRWVIYLFLHGRLYRRSLQASGGKMVSEAIPGEVSKQRASFFFFLYIFLVVLLVDLLRCTAAVITQSI